MRIKLTRLEELTRLVALRNYQLNTCYRAEKTPNEHDSVSQRCFMFSAWCFLPCVSCFMFPAFCFLFHVSCFYFSVLCFLLHVFCLISPLPVCWFIFLPRVYWFIFFSIKVSIKRMEFSTMAREKMLNVVLLPLIVVSVPLPYSPIWERWA